jgi:hypothetical protein
LLAQMPKATGGRPPKPGTIKRKTGSSEDPGCSASSTLMVIRRSLTLLASVLKYLVVVFDMWREKGKDRRPTMEDFLNWELGQYEQQCAPGPHPKRIIRLEHPIHTQHRNEAEREVRRWPSQSNTTQARGESDKWTSADMSDMLQEGRPSARSMSTASFQRGPMTKRAWLQQAKEIEQQIADLMSQGEDGIYIEYLHQKANACRALAVEAKEE